ncbi:potassium channel family protein, partial [Chloroflexota bacterium]
MYIIIVGGGRVGYFLAQALMDENHEVLVVEKNKPVYDSFLEMLGSICFYGDGCEATVLAEVGTGRADMLVAVTGDDEDNLIACEVAKFKFNVPHTIARLRNPSREKLFKTLGVDTTVSATQIILESITQQLP